MDEVRVPDDKLLEHVEHKRRNYLIGGAARTLAATAVLAFGGMQVGEMVGSSVDSMEVEKLSEETNRINQKSGDLDEANKNFLRVSKDLGEACSTQMKLYLVGGPLVTENEELVINDLLREPSQPCGDSATNIRQNIRSLNSAITVVLDEEENKFENQDYLANLESQAESKDTTTEWGHFGLLVGSIIGAITGNKIARRYNHKKKDQLMLSKEYKRLLKNNDYTIYSDHIPAEFKKYVDKTSLIQRTFPEL